jgi:RNAse (barnase) inhibitor barstar
MGRINGPYKADFPVGTTVSIASRPALEAFMSDWKWHHPLQSEQLAFANQVATVAEVYYYHGADELYALSDVPGLWHEVCLAVVTPIVIDLSDILAASALHDVLARTLGFPDYYGRNWDAFDECFGDPDVGLLPDAIRFVGWQTLAQRLPQDAKLLRQSVENGLANGLRCKVEWAG